MVVDLETNEVLAVKRGFKVSGHNKTTPSRIWWGNARSCESNIIRAKGRVQAPVSMRAIVTKALVPIRGVNDQFIPKRHKPKGY